jgi:oxygen-independent coproporphyrinogen-3 oxidase
MYKYEKFVEDYLDALEREIKSIYKGEVLETIYIGGGTPSSLNIRELKRLFDILSIFKKDSNIEYTIENNFENIDKEKLELYKSVGINRLSFGIETTNKESLKLLDRELDLDKVKDTIKICRELGFNNINVDLMYALPNESIKDLENDLKYIYSLDVEHISTYSLIIEDNTKLKIHGTKNVSEDLDYEMYKYICSGMKSNGYKHYEISNFAKDGYYSKHNLCYWDNDCYYGFGLGASSYIDNMRITNTRSLDKYKNDQYVKEVEYLKDEDKIEYEVILNLRKSDGIDLINFKSKYNKELIDVYNYKDLVELGVLELKDNHLYISEDKWYISNSIIVDVLERKVYG